MDRSWQFKYLISIYWAFTTVSSVGYGDISASNNLEMFVGMIIMLAGTTFYAYAIGSLTSLLTELNIDNEQLNQKIQMVKNHQKISTLDNKMAQRIIDHVKSRQVQSKYEDIDSLTRSLPPYLTDKIVKITHGQCYKKIHFFRNAAKTSPDLNSKIIHELRALSMGPNEMIYQ